MRSRMSGKATRLVKVVERLDLKVAWASIHIIRISYIGDSFCSLAVVLWIDAQPESPSVEDGTNIARSCQEILAPACWTCNMT